MSSQRRTMESRTAQGCNSTAGRLHGTNSTTTLRPTSSFAAVPPTVFLGGGFLCLGGIATKYIPERIQQLQTWLTSFGCEVTDLPTINGEASPSTIMWTTLGKSALKDGRLTAIPYFAVAVIMHHVRRTLLPGLGAYVIHQPGEDMRQVLGRPDVFLEVSFLSAPWTAVVLNSIEKAIIDALAVFLAPVLFAADNDAIAGAVHKAGAGLAANPALASTLVRRTKDIATVVFLMWLFSCIEYAVSRTFNSVAFIYACWSLLCNQGMVGRAVFRNIVTGHALSALLLFWSQILFYPAFGILPLVSSAVLAARRGQYGLLLSLFLAVSGMHVLLRYRSRLYIAIETSGFFVFLFFVCVSAAVVFADRWACSCRRPAGKHVSRKKND